jgi:hypothetical protein
MKKTLLALLATAFIALVLPAFAASNPAPVWEKLKAWHGDVETKEDRHARLTMVDISIDRAVERATCDKDEKNCKPLWKGNKEDLRWILIGQSYFETHFAKHVHADECRVKLGECDGGNAKSLWQIQKTSNALPEVGWWDTIGGIDQASTDRAAWAATRILSRTYNRCKSISGAISMYATGRTCFWEDGPKRARWISRARARYSPRMAH